jgi:hypothetical protein
MMQYTTENTEGYSAYDLTQMNRIYEHRIALLDEHERQNADLLQHISEQVLYEYDVAQKYEEGWAEFRGRIYGLTQQPYCAGRIEFADGHFLEDAYAASAEEIETGRSAQVYWVEREEYDPYEQDESDACDWDRPVRVDVESD